MIFPNFSMHGFASGMFSDGSSLIFLGS